MRSAAAIFLLACTEKGGDSGPLCTGTPAAQCGEVESVGIPADAEVCTVVVYGVLPKGSNEYEAVEREIDTWEQVGNEVFVTCPDDLIDATFRVGYR